MDDEEDFSLNLEQCAALELQVITCLSQCTWPNLSDSAILVDADSCDPFLPGEIVQGWIESIHWQSTPVELPQPFFLEPMMSLTREGFLYFVPYLVRCLAYAPLIDAAFDFGVGELSEFLQNDSARLSVEQQGALRCALGCLALVLPPDFAKQLPSSPT